MNFEVIEEPSPQSGEANMRIDSELLDSVSQSGDTAFVRIYRWQEPTISLGYFQKDDDVSALDARWQDCPVVKRLTGGGAILHDQELTYSIALPASHPFRHEPVSAYEQVHQAIVDLLTRLGAPCAMRGEAINVPRDDEPFLCFLRGDPRDVVIGPNKIIGSAQRRRRGAILQHGSILLRSSALLSEVPGLADLYPEQWTSVTETSFQTQLGSTICASIRAHDAADRPAEK